MADPYGPGGGIDQYLQQMLQSGQAAQQQTQTSGFGAPTTPGTQGSGPVSGAVRSLLNTGRSGGGAGGAGGTSGGTGSTMGYGGGASGFEAQAMNQGGKLQYPYEEQSSALSGFSGY